MVRIQRCSGTYQGTVDRQTSAHLRNYSVRHLFLLDIDCVSRDWCMGTRKYLKMPFYLLYCPPLEDTVLRTQMNNVKLVLFYKVQNLLHFTE